MGLLHGLTDSSVFPALTNPVSCSSPRYRLCGGKPRVACLIGGSFPVSILCSIESVMPKLLLFADNKSQRSSIYHSGLIPSYRGWVFDFYMFNGLHLFCPLQH